MKLKLLIIPLTISIGVILFSCNQTSNQQSSSSGIDSTSNFLKDTAELFAELSHLKGSPVNAEERERSLNHLKKWKEFSAASNKGLNSIKEAPFSATMIALHALYFDTAYGAPNSTITKQEYNLDLDEFKTLVDYNEIQTKEYKGVAVYPIVYEQSGIKKFSFILVKAHKTVDQNQDTVIKPIKNLQVDSVQFVLFKHSPTSYSIIDSIQTVNYLNMYQNTVLVKIGDSTFAINILNHPGACFYKGVELKDFLDHNLNDIPGNPQVTLHFKHIAVDKKYVIPNDPTTTCRIHSPVLYLKINNVTNISDILYPDRYYEKAIDLGYLCPPDCK